MQMRRAGKEGSESVDRGDSLLDSFIIEILLIPSAGGSGMQPQSIILPRVAGERLLLLPRSLCFSAERLCS